MAGLACYIWHWMAIRPHLDATAETPLYRQLRDYLQGLIESGGLQAGERLPPTRDLAGLLGLNRTTVSAAYDLLSADGWIEARGARGSFVRELAPASGDRRWDSILNPSFARASLPPVSGVIDFTTSRPSAALFPIEEFRKSAADVLASDEIGRLLQLGSPRGYEPLRQYLLDQARRDGTAHPGDDILITSGCQQAVDLLRRTLVRAGDRVLMEEPVYPGLRNSFREAGADITGIPVSEDGIDLDRLGAQLSGARLLIVTPSFQNPTGAAMPASNRAELLRRAAQSGVIVVENDIYSSLRYSGTHQAPLKQADGGVIQMGSFSKIAFPGIRVGWILGPRPVIDRAAEFKQITDLHTDQLSQAILLHFAERGMLEKHRERVILSGREKLRALEQAARRHLAGCQWTLPAGGMNLWLELPQNVDSSALRVSAREAGIDYLPGNYFSVTRPFHNALRLSFIGLEPDQIRRGIEILGQLVRNSGAWRSRETYTPVPALV